MAGTAGDETGGTIGDKADASEQVQRLVWFTYFKYSPLV